MWDEYYLCENIEEAVYHLKRFGGEARVIAGGTDLLLQMEAGHQHAPALVDITRIKELREITRQNKRIFIGAAVTFRQIIHSELIHQHASHLVSAAQMIAGRQIRNAATVVGNIVNASPAADSAPVLYTLDAHVHFINEQSIKCEVPIIQFITGVGKTILPRGGLVTAISFPLSENGWRMGFRKLGLRRSMAIAIVNTAFALFETDGLIQEARIAFGAAAPTPLRAVQAEQALIGVPLRDAARSDAPELARFAASPIDDFRASANYRLHMIENLLRQELGKLSKN